MISEEEKTKAVGQFKLQMNGVLEPFDMYGMSVYIPTAIEEITELALFLHKRLNGQAIPITHEEAKRKVRSRKK